MVPLPIRHRHLPQVERALTRALAEPDVVSLAGGVPADDLFPEQSMAAAMERTLAEEGARALQYGFPKGLERLRGTVAARLAARGVRIDEDRVLITAGAQQALCMLALLLVDPGAHVAVETPTYASALQAFDLRHPVYDALARALTRARVLYVVPTGHNPTGGVLTVAQRQEVLEAARRAGAWVVDDDAYGEIALDSAVPPLLALAEPDDRVVHLGSFSKVLAPGLRVGFLVGPRELVERATALKQALDLETATVSQRVLARWLADQDLDAHVARCLPVYRSRRDALLAELDRRCRDVAEWTVPAGGFSLELRPTPPCDTEQLLAEGLRAGAAWEPSRPYHLGDAGRGAMRLSFANVPVADLARGVERLATVLRGRSARG
jgi:2-aminoadipate transaminase